MRTQQQTFYIKGAIVQAWPFLLTKSVRQDYFTVLCPKYIIDEGLQRAFRTELNGLSLKETIGPERKLLQRSGLGNVTILYRCDRARAGGVELRDAQGRPFVRVYGILVKGLHGDIGRSEEINAAYRMALEEIDKAFADLCAKPGAFDTRPSSVIHGGLADRLRFGLADRLRFGLADRLRFRLADRLPALNQILAALIAFLVGAGLVYLPLKRELQMRQTEIDKVQGELKESLTKINALEAQIGELHSQLEKMKALAPAPPTGAPPESVVPNTAPAPR
jgi:hypothetical protein